MNVCRESRRQGWSEARKRSRWMRLVAALPPRQREVVVLRIFTDLSVAETAEVLGVPEGTVKSNFAKAIAALRARLQADFFHAAPGPQAQAIAQVLPYTDLLAVSTYPFAQDPDPGRLRSDHFSALTALAPGKPFAVAETTWPAEDVTAPYPSLIPASDASQRAYVERLLAEADRLSAVFVNWFFTRDYDDLWQTHLRGLANAPLLRLWKDTGLYAGDGRARTALEVWRSARERPRR